MQRYIVVSSTLHARGSVEYVTRNWTYTCPWRVLCVISQGTSADCYAIFDVIYSTYWSLFYIPWSMYPNLSHIQYSAFDISQVCPILELCTCSLKYGDKKKLIVILIFWKETIRGECKFFYIYDLFSINLYLYLYP